MKKVNTVYILGAGCSCEEGAPLVCNFFSKMEELLKTELSNHPNIENLKKILALRNSSFKEYNIEEFFSLIDFLISIDIGTGDSETGPHDLKSMRKDLVFLIAKTIKYSLNDATKPKNYKEFYTKCVTGDDVIISLNWELLLDNCRNGINYGVSFQKYDLDSGDIEDSINSEKIPVLKLHGSLNFLDCDNPKCKARFYSYRAKALEVFDEKKKCPDCKKGNLRIILVPPTTFKNLGNFEQLQDTWHRAFESLKYCDKIRFVGYSLPTADVDFKHLLKAALNSRKSQPIIEVFNYKKNNEERIEFEKHYNRAFDEITDSEKPIKFHYTKFSEFVPYIQVKQHQ